MTWAWWALMPLSMVITWPLMYFDSRLARKVARAAISSGSPNSGVRAWRPMMAISSGATLRKVGVITGPGAMALQRTRWWACWVATYWVSEITPALEAP